MKVSRGSLFVIVLALVVGGVATVALSVSPENGVSAGRDAAVVFQEEGDSSGTKDIARQRDRGRFVDDEGSDEGSDEGDDEGFDTPTILEGTVSNGWTGEAIEGAAVLVGEFELFTNAAGYYRQVLDPGEYVVMFEAPNYLPMSETVEVSMFMTTTLDAALTPEAPVVVQFAVDGEAVPGGVVTATATIEVLDGSTVTGATWEQLGGAEATIGGFAETDTVTVELASKGEYKDELIHVLSEPPIGADQLPPNVPLPPGEFPGGLQDRFQVVGLYPFALEEAALVTLGFQLTTTSGMYEEDLEIHTHLPWKSATGIRNVPLGIPVLLHGKTQDAYDWAMTTPTGSMAMLEDATAQSPEFTPDVAGLYDVSVTDGTEEGLVNLEIFVGNWRGVIVAQNMDGRPLADEACTTCHGTFVADQFTPWSETGHAEIFTNNLNTSHYWGPRCFSCHTVGYDLEVDNGGIDDVADYAAFLDSGLIGSQDPNAWSETLVSFPNTAMLANIQCENCHGPQREVPGIDSGAHGIYGAPGEPRASLSSDMCAVCHGEPLRHARFQQWQLSAHANYEVAIDESQDGSCSRCHTGNGFLAWLPILTGDEPGDPSDDIDTPWTEDEAHPQTCATCHDPHMIGTSSGNDNNATVRISGDTPPLLAGFTAFDVGRGAICMTCHNSRRGLRNDEVFDGLSISDRTRAPHGSAQTDVLQGENGYFVTVGDPGNHSSMVEDSCTNCHMQQTPPPDILSYNQGGSNHTFYASPDICAECHDGLTAGFVQGPIESKLHELQDSIEAAILDLINEQVQAGNAVDLDEELLITAGNVDDIEEIIFGESRGRQAITVVFAGDTYGPFGMNNVNVVPPAPTDPFLLYAVADDELVKSGWNWGLIHNDSSLGVHNPTFADQVLSGALGALPAQAAGGSNVERDRTTAQRGFVSLEDD